MNRRSTLITAAAALVILVLGYAAVERAAIWEVKRTDFTVYMAAARSVLHGGADLYAVTNERGWHYTMPPVFAVLVAPLALLPPIAAVALWYAISMALLIATLRVLPRLVLPEGERASTRWAMIALPLLFCADPLLDTLTRSQLGVVMLAAATFALACHRAGRSFAAGLVVAFATLLKVYTGLLVFFFLFRKQWRALLGCAAGFVLFGLVVPTAAFGPRLALDHWRTWTTKVVFPFAKTAGGALPFEELQSPSIAKNQSLYGTFSHLSTMILGESESRSRDIAVKLAAAAATLALLALLLREWLRRSSAAREGDRYRALFDWSLPLLAGLLIIPTSWSHYFSLWVLPLAAAFSYARFGPDEGSRRTMRRALVAMAVLIGLYSLSSLVRPLVEERPLLLSIAMVPRSAGLFCFATLVLFGTEWRLQRRHFGREARS
jgi:alpha-1,2-mannosyltransferase